MATKQFTIEYDQMTPMGMSSSATRTEVIETNTARNAMRRFESENKEYMRCDMYGDYASAYQITGWEVVAVNGTPVKHEFDSKKQRIVYKDAAGNILA